MVSDSYSEALDTCFYTFEQVYRCPYSLDIPVSIVSFIIFWGGRQNNEQQASQS